MARIFLVFPYMEVGLIAIEDKPQPEAFIKVPEFEVMRHPAELSLINEIKEAFIMGEMPCLDVQQEPEVALT